jgi:SNF2 family DNA or RNA helicase
MQLYPYQEKAVNFALSRKNSYMMIDMGLGKTAIAITAMAAVKLPALVLCPIKVGYNVWTDELKKWAPHLTYTIFHGPDKDKKLKWDTDVYILPYSSLKWFYTNAAKGKFRLRKFFVIFDESTFIKSWSTNRWKTYVQPMMPIFSKYRMCLSGSPTPNGLVDLWTQYYVLDGGKTFGRFPTKYRDRFFVYTGSPRYQTIIKPGSQNQIYNLIRPNTIRLDAKDYLDLPPITYNQIKITTPPEIIKLDATYKREQVIEFEDGMTAVAFDKAGLSNKRRQLSQGALYLDRVRGDDWKKPKKYRIIHKLKAQALKEVVDGLNGQPVIIPIQFKFDYDILCSVFAKNIPVIRGGTSERIAQDLISKWNTGGIPILLCHPGSIGHGVNLQYGGHNIIWYALPWSLDQFIQLNARLHRRHQKHGVVVNVLTTQLPIEMHVYRTLRNKNSTQRDLLNAIRQA